MNDLDKLFGAGFESAGSTPTTANPPSSGALPILLLVIGSCILIGMAVDQLIVLKTTLVTKVPTVLWELP